MTYSTSDRRELPPVFLTTWSLWSVGRGGAGSPALSASATWSATNRIIYVPFTLSEASIVYRYFWLNGATVGTNNFQVGVYDAAFAQIHEGTSTLSAGTANLLQFDNVTDFSLIPGSYYMAMWGSGTTATVFRASAVSNIGLGIYYETNAGGLPATGTPSDTGGSVNAVVPIFGLALRPTDP